MENHPIPQDVTGFQFKLIGNMTVKQFAYVASGTLLAVLVFYSPLSAYIKLPLLALSLTIGFSLAFVPFEGRPIDLMLMYYLKALLVPNQYVYQKQGKKYVMPAYHAATIIDPAKAQTPVQKPLAIKEQQLQTYLSSLHATNLPNTTLQTPQTPVPQLLSVSTPQFMPTAQTPLPTYSPVIHISQHSNDLSDRPSETKEPEDNKKNLSIKTAELQKELAEAKLVEAQQQTAETSKSAHQNTLALEKQLKEIADQKASLEQQLLQLKKQLDFQTKPLQQPTTTPPAAQVAPAKPSPRLVTKLPPKPVAVVMKTPDFPNLVTGIIKDPRGNVLSNILIEILDKDNNPVRAFKTNAMGQFASATTLTNGDYIVTFEDPRGQHTFANIAISAKGEILAPLDITSQDARDELRKELFS